MSREAFQEEEWGRGTVVDDLLSVLADSHRRFVISYLEESEEPVSVGQLAREIREWEEERPNESTPDEGQIIASLYHRHLPKLSEADIVDFDREQDSIQSGEALAEASTVLEELTQVVQVKGLCNR